MGKAPDFFTIVNLREHLHCSRYWVEQRLRDSDFPRPIKFGGCVNSFDEVMAIFKREERRDAARVGNVVPFPSARRVAS